MKVIISMPA